MNEIVTHAQAPTWPRFVRKEANLIAERGHVAIVGIAVTFNDTSNGHRELIRDNAFPLSMAAPLFDDHPDPDTEPVTLGRGVLAYPTPEGLICVWELVPAVEAFDRIIEAVADGTAGLSISFKKADPNEISVGGHRITEHTAGNIEHVALTDSPSYRNARVLGIVSGFATLLRPTAGSLVSLSSPADIVTQRQHVALTEYAHTGNPAAVVSMSPAMQVNIAASDAPRLAKLKDEAAAAKAAAQAATVAEAAS